MMHSLAWMSIVITICKKVIKVLVVKIKYFQKILQPKNQTHLNQKPNTLLPLLHPKMIRTIWRNMLKSKMSMDWTVSLDPHAASATMAHPHQQHPSPTVRRDIVVIKDKVHIISLFRFSFDFFVWNETIAPFVVSFWSVWHLLSVFFFGFDIVVFCFCIWILAFVFSFLILTLLFALFIIILWIGNFHLTKSVL